MKKTHLGSCAAAMAWVSILIAVPARAESNRLQLAIGLCQVDKVNQLLQAGADPNARDRQGHPILRWLASNRSCSDATALATAKSLEEHGADFRSLGGTTRPSLLVMIATRGLPETLAFLCPRSGPGEPTQALQAIARRSDLASIRVLLSAGADPLAGNALRSALFDAAAEGLVPSVSEMLKHVEDKQSPKVLAAYKIAARDGHRDVEQIFLNAGVKPPTPSSPPREWPCRGRELTSAQAGLLAKLGLPNAHRLAGLAGRMDCKLLQECGDLLLVDCNSAADGPAYYINQKTSELLATCGGACMLKCTNCPPKEWTCECKR